MKNVLSDINLTIPGAAMTALLGPNGAGKTTMLHSIGGLIPEHFKGKIDFGNDIDKVQIAMVEQSTSSLPMSVYEYVMTGRIAHRGLFDVLDSKKDLHVAEQAMREVDILHLANRKMGHLSSGERQLCSIARAMTQEPDIMLLDEPISNLDIKNQEQIMHLLKDIIVRHTTTIVIVIHDINIASRYADNIVILNDGRVLTDGPTEESLSEDILSRAYGVQLQRIDLPLTKPHIFIPK
ncbi:MAG: ABC transporter ATP-binding protein [Marinilabiliaceae bacterium]|nr:ABC transporter ATP-binding protein [Marinilabiliaceae bacterium]